MSDDNSSESESNEPKEAIKLDEKFVIKLTNQSCCSIIDRNVKQSCKVLQVSSELHTDQKLNVISTLEPSECPNLFIFIIENRTANITAEKVQQLEEHLIKFGSSRPLIMLQRFEDENVTKFYYKAENSTQIVDIDQHYAEDHELYEKWKRSINILLDQEIEPFEDEILKKLSCIKDSSIVLRFLRTLNLEEEFFWSIVLKIAENGSKADLLAVLDALFEDNGRMLNNRAQDYIITVFEDNESQDALDDDQDDPKDVDSDIGKKDQDDPKDVDSDIGKEEQDDPMDVDSDKGEEEQDDPKDEAVLQPKKPDSYQSVLLTAVQHKNKDVIDYLITFWSHLIQQLPIDHQKRISTVAYNLNQFDIVSDLVKLSDFPFPDEFTPTKSEIDEKLLKITEDRMEFKAAIEREDFVKIDSYIDRNMNNKIIYSIDNKSALTEAASARQFGIFYYLKSLGFQGENCLDVLNTLNKDERAAAVEKATKQRKSNVQHALKNCHRSVYNLCGKSLIHNRKISKELEVKYREKIMIWFRDIQKIAPEMLDVVASCENLKIIFDFESQSVENASLDGPNVLGAAYPNSKWIFVGSKFADKAREQKIKGVLAHELCHYVMGMVYENQEFPHYKDDKQTEAIFKEIVTILNKWTIKKTAEPDDECDGTISTVYRLYDSKDFGPELIVRCVHMLAHYDDNLEKTNRLQGIYQDLFDFWYNHVVPDMQNYFKKDQVAIRVNATVGLLLRSSNNEIEFTESKDIEQMTGSKVAIVTTNVPKLLFINIQQYLKSKCGFLLNSQNLYLEPEKIKNEQVWKDLNDLNARDVKLNVFVDGTKDELVNLNDILSFKVFNFILVTSSEEQSKKLIRMCKKKKMTPTSIEINYNWSDLAQESQKLLLKFAVSFQNSKSSLLKLLSKTTNSDHNEVLEDYSNIINDQLLNLLIDKQEILINSNAGDDSKKNNFESLYQNRMFLKKGFFLWNEISQEELISITEDNKYVLISDIAGSGKSWVVKNISKIIRNRYPTRWVTYVDLKDFIKEFKKPVQDFEFANYFVEKILKPKTKFEEEIFKKLYKNGKVSIIFDAFDEIAPDCAEFVAKLAQSFELNNRNQMWIVTRDYFEVNLQQKLGIKSAFKLDEFTEQDGINFIVASWEMTDPKDPTIKNSSNLEKYQEKAKKIVQKVTMSKNRSIGLPQLFSMIANSYKDDKFMVDDLKRAKIFENFVNAMYTRWADHKGIIRKQASVQSLDYELKFKEIHQYCAIASLFLELVELLFPDYDKSEWPEIEIIACGIMYKFGSFNHETIREFFVADFLFKSLKKPKVKKVILDLLTQILTIQKYGIIRMFLNDFIVDYSILEKAKLELIKSVEKFENMENLSEYFTENQEYLAKLVIEILKKLDYEKVRQILSDNIEDVVTKTKDSKMFLMFTEFLFSHLKDKDIMDMINDQSLLHKMIGSEIDVENFENFVSKLEEKFGREFVQQELKLMATGPENGNIFHHLGTSQNLSANKVQKFFEIIQKYLNENEIVKMMDTCNRDGQTVFNILVQNTRNFIPFIDGAESFLKDRNLIPEIKRIVCKTDLKDEHILHWCARKGGIDFHSSLWNLIKKTFVNQEEFATFVLQKNKSEDKFLHLLIKFNKSDVIEFTLHKLNENLNEFEYQDVLRSKGEIGQNLLHVAACSYKGVKTHQMLWKELKASCKSNDEFLEILGECDENGDNILGLTATFSTGEILKFMQQELEKLGMQEKVKKLLTNLGFARQHLLQAAAQQNNSLKLHKALWEILEKYFNSSEILQFVQHRDTYKRNMLLNAIEENTKEVKEFTWKKVKELLKSNDLITEENKENIQKCEKIMKSSSKLNQLGKDEREILKLKWIKNKNSEASKLFVEAIQKLINQKLKDNNLKHVKILVADESIEHHKRLWEVLTKTNKYRNIIEELSSEVDENGNNFVHLLVIFNSTDVIAFTLNKFKENLEKSEYQKILKSKGKFGRNLLQCAACFSVEVKTHQILWKELQDSCKSNDEFMEILNECDESGNDVFYLAAAFTTGEIFEFLEEELAKVGSREEIRNIFVKLGLGNRNLLQVAAEQNKSLELHKILWKILKKYFNAMEIEKFIEHLDIGGNNLKTIAEKLNTKEIQILASKEENNNLKEIGQKLRKTRKYLEQEKSGYDDDEDEHENTEIVGFEWIENQNELKIKSTNFTLNHLEAYVSNKNVPNHESLWKHLQTTFKDRHKLFELISETNENGINYIHLLVINNSTEVIELTLQKLKENFHESDYKEVLRSKGFLGRNLLQLAACSSKEVKTHQILWKELRGSCKSNDEFMEILGECDEDGDNILRLTATFSTGEILKFMQQELEKLGLHEKVKKLLTNLGFMRRHLLEAAAQQNKSLELHEVLWEILEKYFNSSEILQFIQHRDAYGDNVLSNAIKKNTKEVKELTWTKVRNALINTENKDNENFKKCDEVMKKDKKLEELTKEEIELLTLDWIDSKKSVKLFEESIQLLIQNTMSIKSVKNLKLFMREENVENHEILWKHLEENFNNYEDLKKLLFEKDENGDNFIHLLVIYNLSSVIEFTLHKLKENFSESDYKEILKSKRQFGRNLLHVAACSSKEVKTHQILWKELQRSCKYDDEFKEILGECDENGDNILGLAATFSTGEILKFMHQELEKLGLHEKVKKLLTNLRFMRQHLLQAAATQNYSLELHEVLWEILEKYFNSSEILQFVQHCDAYGDNVLSNAIKKNTKEVKELTWTKVRNALINTENKDNENFKKCDEVMKKDKKFKVLTKEEKELLTLDWIDSKKSVKLFQDSIQLLIQKKISIKSVKDLKLFMRDENFENHEILWKHLEENFNNYEDLKKLIFEKNENGNNFIHLLVIYNLSSVIEFTLHKLKENVHEPDYQDVLRSKGRFGQNLLQRAACSSKEDKTHQILWKELRRLCKSDDEFMEILVECDENGDNILGLAATFSTGEILKFMHQELEKLGLHEKVKKLLTNLGFMRQHLLHAAATQNYSLELHEVLWEILEKYFNSSEILQFVQHRDVDGDNVLLIATKGKPKEFKELTWTKVRNALINTENKDNENFQKCDEIMKKDKKLEELTKEEIELLRLDWIDSKKSVKLFQDSIQQLIQKKISIKSVKDLKLFMRDENIENHEILWKHLKENFNNHEDLKKLMFEKDENGDNFIHLLVIYNLSRVIEFTLHKLKENFNELEYQKILKLKGEIGRNLLQVAACYSEEVDTHQMLWKALREICKSNAEFLEILKEVDDEKNNLFHLAAAFTSKKIFEFMISELEKLANHKELREILRSFGNSNSNLLQSVSIQNKSLETHESVWKTICKYFNNEEILEFIEHRDINGDNLLCCAVLCNTKEIVDFTWNQIKAFISTREGQVEYLNKKGWNDINLHQLSLKNDANDSQVAVWVQQIMQEYEIKFAE